MNHGSKLSGLTKDSKTLTKAINTQVGGDHYTAMGIQPLDACYQNFGYMGLKASVYTKVLKYFRSKTNEVEDIKKAIHVMQILLEKAEEEVSKNTSKTKWRNT